MKTESATSKPQINGSSNGDKNSTKHPLSNMALKGVRVVRRNGQVTEFDPNKISIAIGKAFLAVEGSGASTSTRIHDTITLLTEQISTALTRRLPQSGTVHIEDIQDQVELALMRGEYHQVARSYVLYREEHARLRTQSQPANSCSETILQVTGQDGSQKLLNTERLKQVIDEACQGLSDVSAELVFEQTLRNLFEGVPELEVANTVVMSARAHIEQAPDYSFVAARLLLDKLRSEALNYLGKGAFEATVKEMQLRYADYFSHYIHQGIELELIDPVLGTYNLNQLGEALQPERDLQFTYLGLQTLYDRYFIHHQGIRFELPQAFFMRVAMGLAMNEADRENKTIEFYRLLSSFDFMSSTPTLFNSGTLRPQLSSCYLTTVPDDLEGIFSAIKDDAMLSKYAGGLGNDWSRVRAMGSHIKGTNGQSQGVVPFLKVANDTAVAVNQCFAADTPLYTAEGVQAIRDIKQGDLVLGMSGRYREVTERMVYNQHDPMVAVDIKHAIKPTKVTAGHPFYALCNIPVGQANSRTYDGLEKGTIKPDWVEAGELQKGDYIAQVIPKEIVPIDGFTEEDARLYGILLGDGHLSKDGMEWGVSGNPENDTHLQFVCKYLDSHFIHFWEIGRHQTYVQIRWASGQGALRDATTGRITGAGERTLPFSYDEIYNSDHKKYIARRYTHLPHTQALALLQGLLETDGGISRGKEIYFTNTSYALVEGLRYQCLRLGIPTAGQYRERDNTHTGTRSDGTTLYFKGITKAYDVRIPAVDKIAGRIGCKPITKHNWLNYNGCLYSRVRSVERIPTESFVFDLKVEGDESYMTTSALVHNGGKRKGAMCAYLETWHMDIEEFLELRKNTGDDRRRTHDMNTANWIPDLFMKRVAEAGEWSLFSPDEVPDLHSLFGIEFERAYIDYEAQADRGEMKLFKRIPAIGLWRKMISMLFETGHPWLCFSGDTKVAVADGREPVDIKELAESTEKFPVYSARAVSESALNFKNKNQRHWIEEIKMATAFKSGKRNLIKVYLDDGSSFRCTEDHLLALKDGGYVRADEAVGLSLCPFNRWQDAIRPNNRYIGRNKDPGQRQANMIWNFYYGDIPKGYVVDHIKNGHGDFINNLQLLTIEEHNKKTSLERAGENNPFYGKFHSKEARKKISENTKGFMTDEYKQHLSDVLKGKKKSDRYGLSNPELIIKGREFYSKYNTLSNKSWRTYYKNEGLPSAGYIENRFTYWSNFTDSCINNHKVIKVENTGKTEDVYDLSVEDNHNFFIVTDETDAFKSGVLVHNCFKDPCNLRSPQQHCGVVHSSNLCTEITLNTSDEEIAVCNLGSVNLAAHVGEDGLDLEKLETTISTAMRMLDNVIDYNYYSVPQARRANLRHRPVGLGIMGFQDALYKTRTPYASEQAINFADRSMEAISYFTIKASTDLAEVRGCYSSFEGSLWSQGILPLDSLALLEKERAGFLTVDRSQTLDWDSLRERVKTVGMRNSNTMAVAPTATISNICGVSQSIEPTYQNLFVKSNLSGEFTVVNPYLVDDLKQRGLWDEVMINDLKYYDGSIQRIERIPEDLKQLYATAFELDARWLIEAASRRQKWIDQGQSINLYMAEPDGKKLDTLYKLAWVRGLKTTYYLRSMGATHLEKNTQSEGKLNVVQSNDSVGQNEPKVCSIVDPDCDACQ